MPLFNRFNIIATLLSISVLFETLTFGYLQEFGGQYYYSTSILYFICGLAICILPLISYNNDAVPYHPKIAKVMAYILLLFFMGLIGYHLLVLIPIYTRFPINAEFKNYADMIPIIQLACERFLHCQMVYPEPSQLNGFSVFPYLPMMWIPFLPSVIFDFDARWTTLFFQLLGLLLAIFPVLKPGRKINVIPILITCISLFLALNYCLMKYSSYWVLTEEGIVAGFYLLLGFALLRNNYWLIGMAITCCALSRYSLLLWIPVYLGYIFLTRPKRDFWKLFLSCGISILIFFIIPFFIKDPGYFMRIPSLYANSNTLFWRNNHLVQHRYHCVGLFKFFSNDQISLMFILQLVTAFLAPLIYIFAMVRCNRKHSLNIRYLAFGSLKISLIFFYGFIQQPYLYLFVPATLISYAIMFDFLASAGRAETQPIIA